MDVMGEFFHIASYLIVLGIIVGSVVELLKNRE